MRVTDGLRRAGAVAAMAVVIGGGGVAARATAAGAPAASPNQPAAAAAPAPSGGVVTSYAATVRAVLPSVVLIRTANGLGSGVVLDRAGDVIRKLGPATVTDSGMLLQELAAAHPGQQVEVTITRAGQARTVSVTPGTLPGT